MPLDGTNWPDPVTETLKEARELVRKGWARRYYARTRWWLPVSSSDPSATRFCMIGALHRATDDDNTCLDAEQRLIDAIGADMLTIWNDSHTKRAVLRAFDKAIARR
jgi:hypothetical protein